MRSLRLLPSGNVGRIYVFNSLKGVGLGSIASIVVLFWLDRGLSFGQIMVLFSISGLATIVFEIPTGLLADRFGRKWSLAAGTFLQVVAGFFILFTTSIWIAAPTFILFGLGFALGSGADDALVYDSLKIEGREAHFQAVAGRTMGVWHVGAVLGSSIAGLLARQFELSSVIWAHNLLYLGATAVALSMREHTVSPAADLPKQKSIIASTIANLVADGRRSFTIITRNSQIIVLAFWGLLIGLIGGLALTPYAQPYLVDFGLEAEQVAYAHGAFSGLTALFAFLSARFTAALRGGEQRVILAVAFMLAVAVVLMVNAPVITVAIAGLALVLVVSGGLADPFFSAALNRRIESAHRASVLSIMSMAFGLVGVFVFPLFGLLADSHSLQTSLVIYQWALIPILGIATVLSWRALRSGSPVVMDDS